MGLDIIGKRLWSTPSPPAPRNIKLRQKKSHLSTPPPDCSGHPPPIHIVPPNIRLYVIAWFASHNIRGNFSLFCSIFFTPLRPLTKSPFRLTLLDLWKASIYHLCIFRVPLRRPDRGSLSNENISRRHKKSNSQDMDKSTTNIFCQRPLLSSIIMGTRNKGKRGEIIHKNCFVQTLGELDPPISWHVSPFNCVPQPQRKFYLPVEL